MTNWQEDYHQIMEQAGKVHQQRREKEQERLQNIKQFYGSTVLPALYVFRGELEQYERIVQILQEDSEEKKGISLLVAYQGEKEFEFRLCLEVDGHGFGKLYPYYSSSYPGEISVATERETYFRTQEGQKKTIEEVSSEELLEHVYRHYREKLCLELNVTKYIISDGPLNIDDFSC